MKKIEPEFFTHDKVNGILETYQTFEGKHEHNSALSACIVEDFDFSGIELSDILAIGSTFIRCKFIGCDLNTANLSKSKFIAADFSRANLCKANFYRVEAKNACFDRTNCGGAEFDEANLSGATFRNVDFGGASFVDCDLSNAIFDGSDLTYVSAGINRLDNTSWLNVKGGRLVRQR